MYIAPGQGQTTPWGQNFYVNIYLIYISFHVSPYVYSPAQGQTIHWGQNFDDNRKAFSFCPYVASFKMISSKSDLYTFLMILYMYIAPGQGHITLWEKLCQQKALITLPIRCKFKKRNLILYTFLMILYMSPVKRICVFEHSVMTNFNCACPAIQRGQGSGFLCEDSS